MSQRNRYTKQFKEEAIRLVNQEGVSLTQVARDLGINGEMLRRWRKDAETLGPKAFRGHGKTAGAKRDKSNNFVKFLSSGCRSLTLLGLAPCSR